ncbi:MAG TPA: hypothetical protein VLM77_00025, partial [Methanobacterium sp.]|nr:hypothetical protein [Methanobacterium sp.]
AYKDLIPTMQFELQLVQETEGTLENYKNVSSEVLLLGGSKTTPLLKDSLKALNNILPYSNLVELKGLNHDSAQDYGKPKLIVQEIRKFFQ